MNWGNAAVARKTRGVRQSERGGEVALWSRKGGRGCFAGDLVVSAMMAREEQKGGDI